MAIKIKRALTIWLCIQIVYGNDQTQIERYFDKTIKKSYQIEVPGKNPITIIETDEKPTSVRWVDISLDSKDKEAVAKKDNVNDRYADVTIDHSRCFGPSCRDNYEDGTDINSPDHLEDFLLKYADKMNIKGDANDRLQAISSLASKLKDKSKTDKYESDFDENEDKSYPSSWDRLKVKQHKHPFDDRDGWVTMEAIPYTTSKISKWKPNSNKIRPNHWDDEKYAFDDRYSNSGTDEQYKKPNKRPAYINNKPHYDMDWETEMPSKPSWAQQSTSYPSSWSPDEGRRPHKPNCDSDSHRYPSTDSAVYYGMSDSLVTDSRPSNFPYEYQALKRPHHRPTQVVYAGFPDDDNRSPQSHPSNGDGQWVLLSTTKGYHNSKKRPRSMFSDPDPSTMTSHHAVSLTVLPLDNPKKNMTTSHGGLLEVERSFKSVEESKNDLDMLNIMETGTIAPQSGTKKKLLKRRLVSAPPTADSSSVLAAVGAGMLPATMAMVVPMMLGKKRRRRNVDRITKRFMPVLYRFE